MTKLITRVQNHVTGQATSGKNTLVLLQACIEHMRDHQNEWTPLAMLIGKSQPAQARMCRMIAGKVIEGWSIKKDDKQPSGLRFAKVKGSNQGFDADQMSHLSALVDKGLSIQSKEVREKFTGERAAPSDWTEEDAKKYAKRLVKTLKERHYGGGAFVGILQATLAEEAGEVAF